MSAAIALRRPASASSPGTPWAGHPRLPHSPWAFVNALRSQGHADLGTLAMPSLRDEAWRFTDLAPLAQLSLRPAEHAGLASAADMVGLQLDEATTRLVFVDGFMCPSCPARPATPAVCLWPT